MFKEYIINRISDKISKNTVEKQKEKFRQFLYNAWFIDMESHRNFCWECFDISDDCCVCEGCHSYFCPKHINHCQMPCDDNCSLCDECVKEELFKCSRCKENIMECIREPMTKRCHYCDYKLCFNCMKTENDEKGDFTTCKDCDKNFCKDHRKYYYESICKQNCGLCKECIKESTEKCFNCKEYYIVCKCLYDHFTKNSCQFCDYALCKNCSKFAERKILNCSKHSNQRICEQCSKKKTCRYCSHSKFYKWTT